MDFLFLTKPQLCSTCILIYKFISFVKIMSRFFSIPRQLSTVAFYSYLWFFFCYKIHLIEICFLSVCTSFASKRSVKIIELIDASLECLVQTSAPIGAWKCNCPPFDDRPTDRPTDRQAHRREVALPLASCRFVNPVFNNFCSQMVSYNQLDSLA